MKKTMFMISVLLLIAVVFMMGCEQSELMNTGANVPTDPGRYECSDLGDHFVIVEESETHILCGEGKINSAGKFVDSGDDARYFYIRKSTNTAVELE